MPSTVISCNLRQFCRLMGGDITVTSIHGQGSTFSARLPTRVAEPATPLA
jgi:signal transduction histidine kinase